jgi:hypothetical protein
VALFVTQIWPGLRDFQPQSGRNFDCLTNFTSKNEALILIEIVRLLHQLKEEINAFHLVKEVTSWRPCGPSYYAPKMPYLANFRKWPSSPGHHSLSFCRK